jgi:uncharacterized delta-60 repeat protein
MKILSAITLPSRWAKSHFRSRNQAASQRRWRRTHRRAKFHENLEPRAMMVSDFIARVDDLFDVDSSFEDYAAANDAAVLPDGKTLVLGGVYSPFYSLTVTRHHPSLGLDTSFGDQGVASISFGTDYISGRDIRVLPDQKILVLATVGDSTDIDLAFIRFNSNGSVDETFGVAGMVRHSWGAHDIPVEMSIKSDGDILVAGIYQFGKARNEDFAVARYNSDGTPDTAFGNEGLTLLKMKPERNDSVIGLRQVSGKILLVGNTIQPQGDFSENVAIARLTSSGKLDKTFDGDGKRFVDLRGREIVRDFLVDSSNRILVCATVSTSSDYRSVVARLNSAGTLDSTFGTNGIAYLDPANEPSENPDQTTDFTQIGIRPDGRIVVVGEVFREWDTSVGTSAIAARLRSDGRIDSSFGGDGVIEHGVGSSTLNFDNVHGMAVLPNGKVLGLGGISDEEHFESKMFVIRFD